MASRSFRVVEVSSTIIMLRLWLIAALFSSSSIASLQRVPKSYENYQVIQVSGLGKYDNQDEILAKLELPIEEDVEVLHQDATEGIAQIMVTPELQDRVKKTIREQALSYEVIIENIGRLIGITPLQRHALRKGTSTFDAYMSFEQIKSYLQSLSETYPNRVKLTTIGKSHKSENITMVTIGESDSEEKEKPVIFIEAGIHAREWISVSSAIYLIEQLLKEKTSLTSKVEWHIIPLANPDGYKYAWNGNRMWRKNRRKNKGSVCFGVDLNRNFDSHWQEAGTSNHTCSAIYGGKSAFSEPETRAIRDAILPIKKRIKAFVSLHSYGQLIIYPPGGNFYLLPSASKELFGRMSNKISTAIENTTGAKYKSGSPAETLYKASGLSMDWAHFEANVPIAFTFELRDTGKTGFLLPAKDIKYAVKDVWSAMKVIYEAVNGMTRKKLTSP